MTKLRNGSKGGFEPGLTCVLSLRYHAPQNTNIIKLLGSGVLNGARYERPASTGLDHSLVVVCDLTQILAVGSGCRWRYVCGSNCFYRS